jgi:hypothetical protein
MTATNTTTAKTRTSRVVPEEKGAELEAVVIVIVTDDFTVFPFSVAFTKSVTVPAVLPAVKTTLEPVVELSVPMALFERAQE